MEKTDINGYIDAFKYVLQNQYVCFDGRMSKDDYWKFMIPAIILYCVLGFTVIVPLGLLLPMVGATTRRLHDLGKSGWMQLISLICCVGPFITLYFCIPDGQAEANQYGEAPSAAAAAPAAEAESTEKAE